MGELIRIYVPKCRIRELFTTGAARMVEAFVDREQAEKACNRCSASEEECPLSEPGVLPLVAEDDPE